MNDRAMLLSIETELAGSNWQCSRCGNSEATHSMDVYAMLRRHLRDNPLRELSNVDSDITQVRAEVKLFALVMENKLRANEARGGWKDCTPSAMLGETVRAVLALGEAGRTNTDIIGRAANVANFAMMYADCCCALNELVALNKAT